MMQTTKQISDKKVFNQMFKALRAKGFKAMQSCTWDEVKEHESYVFYPQSDLEAFDKNGYLTKALYLDFNGDGNIIHQIVKDFGYNTDWDGSNFYKIGVLPVSKEELATR